MFRFLSHASAGFAAALLALAVFAAPAQADGGGTWLSLCNTGCDGREPGGDGRGCRNDHTGCEPANTPNCDNAKCTSTGLGTCNCNVVGGS